MKWKKTPQLWFSWQAILLTQSLSSVPISSFWYTVGLYLSKALSLKYRFFPARNSFFLLLSDTISSTWDLDSPEDYLQLYSCLHFCHLWLDLRIWTVLQNWWCVIWGTCWQRDDLVLRMLGCGLQEFPFLPLNDCMIFVKFTSAISFFSAFVGISWPFSAYTVSLLEKQLLILL